MLPSLVGVWVVIYISVNHLRAHICDPDDVCGEATPTTAETDRSVVPRGAPGLPRPR